jgi:hypothetical protein
MKWFEQLQVRWKVESVFQVIIILIVFACTGFTVLFLKRPLFAYLYDAGDPPWWATMLYYVLILPIYNLILLFYGFVFGQFRFFLELRKAILFPSYGKVIRKIRKVKTP